MKKLYPEQVSISTKKEDDFNTSVFSNRGNKFEDLNIVISKEDRLSIRKTVDEMRAKAGVNSPKQGLNPIEFLKKARSLAYNTLK